jgi:hypothetical protein
MALEVKKALFVCVHYGMSLCSGVKKKAWGLQPFLPSLLSFLSRCVEALTRAGQLDRQLLPKAVSMFEVIVY